MDELYQMMEKEMANAELDVNKATEMMHVSRTKLYYKVKGLTGESPSTFFKTYKLNKAAELIKAGEHTILLHFLQEAVWLHAERIWQKEILSTH
jgi:AraC-like DNA-binding protein